MGLDVPCQLIGAVLEYGHDLFLSRGATIWLWPPRSHFLKSTVDGDHSLPAS